MTQEARMLASGHRSERLPALTQGEVVTRKIHHQSVLSTWGSDRPYSFGGRSMRRKSDVQNTTPGHGGRG
jgi:hypothetical protein